MIFLIFPKTNLWIKVETHFKETISKITRYAIYSKFATFSVFEKKNSLKKPSSFQIKKRFERFEKSYYFNHIVGQIC